MTWGTLMNRLTALSSHTASVAFGAASDTSQSFCLKPWGLFMKSRAQSEERSVSLGERTSGPERGVTLRKTQLMSRWQLWLIKVSVSSSTPRCKSSAKATAARQAPLSPLPWSLQRPPPLPPAGDKQPVPAPLGISRKVNAACEGPQAPLAGLERLPANPLGDRGSLPGR